MTIGEKLKELRGNQNLQDVASEIGVTVSALSNYENDIRIPRDEIKLNIANYFNCTVDEIFFNKKS